MKNTIALAACTALFISGAVNAQNVGIGTATPSEKLHVVGGARITDLSGTGNRLVQSNATGVLSNIADGTSGQVLTTDGAGVLSFQTPAGSSTAWELLGNGGTMNGTNFVGTTDPQSLDFRTDGILRTRITLKGQIETLNTGQSVFLGEGAGAADDLSANGNVFLGYLAGFANTNGSGNIAVGFQSLYDNTTGFYNTAVGARALNTNTIGTNNVALGNHALNANTTGSYNTASGSFALSINTTGFNNTANGNYALRANTTGFYNTANGSEALNSNTTGFRNTGVGYRSLFLNTTGNDNTATGLAALFSNTTGIANTAIGNLSLYANTSGTRNVAMGYQALYDNTTASYNTAIGYQALRANITGFRNTAIGYASLTINSGSNNIAIGYNSGNNITTGSNNLIFGYDIDAPIATGSNQLSIGNLIYATGVDGTATTVSNGKVGLATNAPDNLLDIEFGNASTGTSSWGIDINQTGTGDLGIDWQIAGTSVSQWYIDNSEIGNPFVVYNPAYGVIYRRNQAGNIGIGVAPSGLGINDAAMLTVGHLSQGASNIVMKGVSGVANDKLYELRGDGSIAMFNSITSIASSATDGILLYAEDVAASSELKVRDESGNISTLSPHNFSLLPNGPAEQLSWAFYSEHAPSGTSINVDMLQVVREVEKLSGKNLVYKAKTEDKKEDGSYKKITEVEKISNSLVHQVADQNEQIKELQKQNEELRKLLEELLRKKSE